MYTTNYFDTFIQVADDCPATEAEVPPEKAGKKTVANLQYDMISANPYKYTSDDVLFQVFAIRQGVLKGEMEEARKKFFSKGQACLRASPLAKRYGFGIHSDANGRVALYPLGSDEYEVIASSDKLRQLKAMRSKRA